MDVDGNEPETGDTGAEETGGLAAPVAGGLAEPESGGTPDGALTAQHRAVLALERRGWASSGAKERAIRERLGLAPVRYYQLLNALLDDPRALAHDPVTVNRLRRVREERRAQR